MAYLWPMSNQTETAANELLTAPEAAARLGIGRSYLAKLARRGVLPVARKLPGIRGDYLFDPADVELLAQERGK